MGKKVDHVSVPNYYVPTAYSASGGPQVQKKVSKKKVKSTKAATNKLDPKQRARLGLKNKMFKGKGAGVKRGGGKAKHAKKNRK